MIRYSLIALATTALVWGAAPSAVQAQTDGGELLILAQRGDFGPPGEGGPRWLQELDLSQEQVQQIQAIHDRYRPQLDSQRQQLQEARDDLRDLMSGNASESQIRQQHDRVQTLDEQMHDLRFNSMLEVRNVLTPAQREQAAALLEERRAEFEDRWQQRQERRQPNR